VTGLTLNKPEIADIVYTIEDPAISWSFSQNFTTMAPLCPYHIEFELNNLPAFIE
jgi:hypothetical protein